MYSSCDQGVHQMGAGGERLSLHAFEGVYLKDIAVWRNSMARTMCGDVTS